MVGRQRLSASSERSEGLNPSKAMEQTLLSWAKPNWPAVAGSVLSAGARQEQLHLLTGLVESESKGQSRNHDPNLGDSTLGALTDATLRHLRAVAATTPAGERLHLARGFAFSAIEAYWKKLWVGNDACRPLPALPQGIETDCLADGAREAAWAIGTSVAGLKEKDASFIIGGLYTAAMPERLRAKLGAHYTPPALCGRLLDMATEAGVDWNSARVLDPACGGGAFLLAVAQRMLEEAGDANSTVNLESIARRLLGFEVDPFAAWMSRVFLGITLGKLTPNNPSRLEPVVLVCDALTRPIDNEGFDLVIGNPPYGRVNLSLEMRKVYRRSLYGHANLYGLFTDLALRYARSGGIIAYVTPTSFLSGMYFKALRGLLGRQAPPLSLDFVNARRGVFADVLQETILATYRRGDRPGVARVHFIRPKADGSVKTTASGAFRLPNCPEEPWLVPRTQSHSTLIHRAAAMPHRLRDYGYTVSTGPLVWNRHKGSLRSAAGKNRRPVIWAEAVRQDGIFEFRALKRNHLPYFEPKPNEAWLVTDFPCVLLQRTTAKEQERRLIAAELPQWFIAEHGEVVVENHLNMIKAVQDNPQVSPAVVAELLNSEVVDQLFRCLNGSVAVSAYELEALPLPSPESTKEIERLVERGAHREQLEQAVQRLYEIESS